MVNKCVVFGCKSGYLSKSENFVSLFRFPLDKADLLQKWKNLLIDQIGQLPKIQLFVSSILKKIFITWWQTYKIEL